MGAGQNRPRVNGLLDHLESTGMYSKKFPRRTGRSSAQRVGATVAMQQRWGVRAWPHVIVVLLRATNANATTNHFVCRPDDHKS